MIPLAPAWWPLGWSQRLPALVKRPSRPEPPSGSQIPAERCFLMGHARQTIRRENELSRKSRLRSMEHEKEHHHAEATKRIDERSEERYRGLHATENIKDVGDEIPHQKNRHQYRPDQSQQRRIFECHARSMNAASVQPQLWLVPSRSPSQRVGRGVTDHSGIEAIDAIRGKMNPHT